MSDALKDTILENASGPASAATDGQSVRQHSLRDQIEAHRYVRSVEAAKRGGLGIKLFKISPGGTP